MSLPVIQVCPKCGGVGFHDRGEDVITPCALCLGSKYVVTMESVDDSELQAVLAAIVSKIDHIKNKCDNIKDKVDQIWDKVK